MSKSNIVLLFVFALVLSSPVVSLASPKVYEYMYVPIVIHQKPCEEVLRLQIIDQEGNLIGEDDHPYYHSEETIDFGLMEVGTAVYFKNLHEQQVKMEIFKTKPSYTVTYPGNQLSLVGLIKDSENWESYPIELRWRTTYRIRFWYPTGGRICNVMGWITWDNIP